MIKQGRKEIKVEIKIKAVKEMFEGKVPQEKIGKKYGVSWSMEEGTKRADFLFL